MSAPVRRLRIAYVYDALHPYRLGGGERRYGELARRLAERHDVHYLTWKYWDGPPDVVRDGIRLHGVGEPPNLYGADGRRTIREALSFAARILPRLAAEGYDVVDCAATPYLPLYTARFGTRLAGTPLVATWHEFWGAHWDAYLPDRRWVARIARWAEQGSLRLGDRHVAVSAFTAARMVEAGLDPNRVTVVGNGITLREFMAAPRSSTGSDIVFVGRLIEDKRVDALLDAVARLLPRHPDLRCLVIGDGPARAGLERLAAERGLGGAVRFCGHVAEDEKLALLKASTMLVLPSVREGFGIAAIEAQAAGLVPIVARSPGSATGTIVRDGVDALVVEPTAQALAEAVGGLLANPARLAALREAAGEAAARWDWGAIADEMEAVYLATARPERAGTRWGRLSWQ